MIIWWIHQNIVRSTRNTDISNLQPSMYLWVKYKPNILLCFHSLCCLSCLALNKAEVVSSMQLKRKKKHPCFGKDCSGCSFDSSRQATEKLLISYRRWGILLILYLTINHCARFTLQLYEDTGACTEFLHWGGFAVGAGHGVSVQTHKMSSIYHLSLLITCTPTTNNECLHSFV